MTFSAPGLVLWVIVLASIAFAAIVVFGLFPWLARSRLRYRLWSLRDRVVDDLIFKRLPSTDYIEDFVDCVEDVIRYCRKLTLLRILIIDKTAPDGTETFNARIEAKRSKTYAALTEPEQKLLSAHETALQGHLTVHVLIGAPSGWVYSFTLFAMELVAGAFLKARRVLTQGIRQYAKYKTIERARVVAEKQRPWPLQTALATSGHDGSKPLSRVAGG